MRDAEDQSVSQKLGLSDSRAGKWPWVVNGCSFKQVQRAAKMSRKELGCWEKAVL